jgi:signal transduction histidine kinase
MGSAGPREGCVFHKRHESTALAMQHFERSVDPSTALRTLLDRAIPELEDMGLCLAYMVTRDGTIKDPSELTCLVLGYHPLELHGLNVAMLQPGEGISQTQLRETSTKVGQLVTDLCKARLTSDPPELRSDSHLVVERDDPARSSRCCDELERERHRIASELHDQVEQTFFAIGLSVAATLDSHKYEADAAELTDALRRVGELARSGADHLRTAIFGLKQAEYADVGLVTTLRDMVQSFQYRTGIATDLVLHGPSMDVAGEVSDVLQAVAGEALMNVERHAHASAVVLKLRTCPRTITLTVTDNGADPPRLALKHRGMSTIHFGLAGLAERVQGMRGTFRAGPGRESGFVVHARLPLRNGQAC